MLNVDFIRMKKHYSGKTWNVELICGDQTISKYYDRKEVFALRHAKRLANKYKAKIQKYQP